MNHESWQFERLASRFADGELEAVEQLEALKRMRSDAAFAAAVEHQVHLRAAVGRVMSKTDDALQAPASLTSSILAMAAKSDESTSSRSPVEIDLRDDRPPVIAKLGPMRWLPTAIAAVLLLGAISLFFSGLGNLQNGNTVTINAVPIVTASQIEAFGRRHEVCVNNPAEMYPDATLADDLQRLPDQIAKRFHASQVPSLDLSPLGYTFDQIGTCSIPGRGAVHLIYTANPQAAHRDRVSLWIVEDQGNLNIEPGIIHTAGSLREHPVLVWRKGGMIYYLTGDQPRQTEQAARMIAQEI